MIIVDIINHLTEYLEIHVGTEADTHSTSFVIVEQTGSSRRNHLTTTTFAIQSHGASMYEAMELNEEVKHAMEAFRAWYKVARVELMTDYNFTNTETKQYRWQAVYNITHY